MTETTSEHYHLVFAEVVFNSQTQKEVSGTRVQIYTKVLQPKFPAARLQQIQNACAMQARMDLGNPPIFAVLDVKILNMIYLGEFADDFEFYAGIKVDKSVVPNPE